MNECPHALFSSCYNISNHSLSSSDQSSLKMNISSAIALFLFSLLLLASSLSLAVRPDSSMPKNTNRKQSDDGFDDFFGPGGGFGFPPGFGKGWGNGIGGGGYGGGYGGPNGGFGKGGIIRNTGVCNVKGPCYKKRVTCPAKCFSSYSGSGKGFGYGGGGGGCTIDCKKTCTAYC